MSYSSQKLGNIDSTLALDSGKTALEQDYGAVQVTTTFTPVSEE